MLSVGRDSHKQVCSAHKLDNKSGQLYLCIN